MKQNAKDISNINKSHVFSSLLLFLFYSTHKLFKLIIMNQFSCLVFHTINCKANFLYIF